MTGAAYGSRLCQALLGVAALLLFASALVLFGFGVALLAAGLLSWLRPIDVAGAWARTLGGLGLVGGSAGLAALGWLAFGAMAHRETAMNRKLKFAAVVGSLLVLICLPFAAAIGVTAHVSWFGWGDAGSGDVRLHSHPAHLSTHVLGSGRISEVPGSPQGSAAPPAATSGA